MNDAKKILVVEDDDVTRELMRMTLERKGYVVVTAEDGLRGYDAAVSVRPDLIITDVNMPAADGVHLVRRVRNTPDIAEIPVIVTTGYGTGNASLTLSQGATAYEPKPIDPASFLATIKRLLSDNGR
ncbi:MAG: response regulator [Pyrinomonadaceae bacterium]|jgi:CheY-like chemotaxis protein